MKNSKIITASEMRRIEALCFEKEPGKDRLFMQKAGLGVAKAVLEYVAENNLEKKAILLIGKGNKGGDAFICGMELLKKGFLVTAVLSFPLEQCSPLCQENGELFKEHKGKVISYELFSFPEQGVIVDGLLGTGFKGEVKDHLLQIIKNANHSNLPIVSIDIPSGVDGDTGKVQKDAIQANLTVYLGFAKRGFFLSSGYNHTKKLIGVDFGLEEKYIAQAHADLYLYDPHSIKQLMPQVIYNRHKYQTGYVLGIAGSLGMTGAAKLSASAAMRSGCGIVRLFFPKEIQANMDNLQQEVLTSIRDMTLIEKEAKRAHVIYVGPGVGRDEQATLFLKELLKKNVLPMVLDADALYLLGKNPHFNLPENIILTPHHKEMLYLLNQEKIDEDELLFFAKCNRFAQEKKVTLVLKGAPTLIFHPHTPPVVIPKGDPGMAKAGSGDVLTGIIASLIAQGLSCYHAAYLGVYLHSLAGEIAAKKLTSYCMNASDLIDNLPQAFSLIIHSK